MNRRDFISGLLLSAAAMVVPWRRTRPRTYAVSGNMVTFSEPPRQKERIRFVYLGGIENDSNSGTVHCYGITGDGRKFDLGSVQYPYPLRAGERGKA